jgi:tetratricopeptide (TPR) repeat protein/TolB-like protein
LIEALGEVASEYGWGSSINARTVAPTFRTKRRKRHRLLMAVVAAVAVVSAGVFALRGFRIGGETPLFVTENRVAVLPIENMIGHGTEAFANGLSEAVADVITEISRNNESMWVIPYYKVVRAPIATPTDAVGVFGVNRVVLGRLQRFADVRRVNLRLCNASDLSEIRAVVLNFDNETGAGLTDSLAYWVGDLMGVDPAAIEPARALHATSAPAMVSHVTGLGWMQRYREGTSLDSALTYLERSVALDPGFAMGHTGLGRVNLAYYFVTKDTTRLKPAIDHFDDALDIAPDLVYANLHRGLAHHYLGDHTRAIESFQRALAVVPGHPRASQRLGRTYRAQGRRDESESAYRAAVLHFPDYWMTQFELGLFHYYGDEIEDAISAWKAALNYAPNDVTTINNIGAAYHQMGEWETAREYFERAFRINPTCESCQNMGLAAFFQGEYEESTRYYEFSLEYCDTTAYDTWGNLASAMYFTDGQRSKAVEVFGTAIRHLKREFQVSPENPTLIAAMITYHAMSGDEQVGRQMIQYGDSVASDDADVLFAIGDAYELFGQRQLALRYIGDAIRLGYVFAEVEWTPNLKDLLSDPMFRHMVAEEPEEPAATTNEPVEE